MLVLRSFTRDDKINVLGGREKGEFYFILSNLCIFLYRYK